MTAIVIFLVFAGVVGVLWIGARDVRLGMMSVGALVQFVIYSVMVAGSVAALSEIWGELQRAAGATERLVELLHVEDTVKDPVAPQTIKGRAQGSIGFENVSFNYPARPEIPALSNMSLSIEPGETVAFVGPSGQVNLCYSMLLRFYDPTAGKITIDGVDLRTLARSDFRRQLHWFHRTRYFCGISDGKYSLWSS